jgi:hypothetical protein
MLDFDILVCALSEMHLDLRRTTLASIGYEQARIGIRNAENARRPAKSA